MQLIYLNAELDSTKEHELNNITPNGFRVEITYKKDSWIGKSLYNNTTPSTYTEVFRNASEVHNLFKDKLSFDEKPIAFESYLNSKGFVRKTKDIEKVVITLEP